MFGCNNFCSYCIVPYVRGREKSREPEAIVEEIKALVADGVTEVMLLGQNVNSYGKTLEHPVTFAQLLKQVEAIEGLKRIRFMTSHPKDLSDELIQTMAESKKVCHHLHLPMQSGSSRILKIMNRRYDKEKYLELVSKIRKAVPDISLTTDIIVGFPGETEEDFQDTLDVVEKCDFDSAFTFIYSKRSGTPAAKMDMEDARFFDLIRYKRADVFEKQLHGLFIYRLDDNGVRRDLPWRGNDEGKMAYPTHFEYEKFELNNPTRYWWTNGFDPKWYLSPFPSTEVNKGYGLVQNPGW